MLSTWIHAKQILEFYTHVTRKMFKFCRCRVHSAGVQTMFIYYYHYCLTCLPKKQVFIVFSEITMKPFPRLYPAQLYWRLPAITLILLNSWFRTPHFLHEKFTYFLQRLNRFYNAHIPTFIYIVCLHCKNYYNYYKPCKVEFECSTTQQFGHLELQ